MSRYGPVALVTGAQYITGKTIEGAEKPTLDSDAPDLR